MRLHACLFRVLSDLQKFHLKIILEVLELLFCFTRGVNMLAGVLRGRVALKRFKADYVLAKMVDGKLVKAEMDMITPEFAKSPKITAERKSKF